MDKYVEFKGPDKKTGKEQSMLVQLILNWKFLIIYGINQIGSLMFSVFVGFIDLGLASLVANGVNFLTTYVIEAGLGLNKVSICKLLGGFEAISRSKKFSGFFGFFFGVNSKLLD